MPRKKQLPFIEALKGTTTVGRKRVTVRNRNIYQAAILGLNDTEIGKLFDVDPQTLRAHFTEFLVKGRERMKMKLRRAQMKAALGGNVTMQIWLGKQMLEQREPEKQDPPPPPAPPPGILVINNDRDAIDIRQMTSQELLDIVKQELALASPAPRLTGPSEDDE